MIHVYCFLPPEASAGFEVPAPPRYSITHESGMLSLGFSGTDRGFAIDKTVSIDTTDKAGSVWQIAIQDGEEANEFKAGEVFGQAGDRFSLFKTKVDGGILADIAFEENGDVNIFLFGKCPPENVAVDGEVTALEKGDKPYAKHAAEHSAIYAEKFRAYSLKSRFLNRVDAHNSIGYLETQVDALTRALLGILPKGHPLYGYLAEADKNSSLDGEAAENTTGKLYGDKGAFRRKQQKYREDKEAAGIASAPPVLPPPPTGDEVRELAKAHFEFFVQKRLDTFAQTRGYDSMNSLVAYANEYEPNQTYRQEGARGVVLKSLTWQKCYEIMAEVLSGSRPMPTEDELTAELPALVWP